MGTCYTSLCRADDVCAYSAEFTKLRQMVNSLSTKELINKLENYVDTHEDRESCEDVEIDNILEQKEKTLFHLVSGKKKFEAQVVLRCNEFNSTTARCESPMADSTTERSERHIKALTIPKGSIFIKNNYPGAKLIGMYWNSNTKMLDGGNATKLKIINGFYQLPIDMKDSVVMVIYKTKGPWHYRKVVWYF